MASSKPALVDIGSHSLALYKHGPEPSTPEDPVVFFVSGVATSSFVWAGVVRQLSSQIRSYTYDRSGFGNSESSPLPPTAENIALELSLLIEKAPISNPLILVGHSWAGVLINEYIVRTDNGRQIAGVIFVDANHETTPLVININDPILLEVFKGIEPWSAKGIKANHKLTKDEWTTFTQDESTEKHQTTAQKELSEYAPSFPTLRTKQLSKSQPILGHKPIYIIGGTRSRDWTGMLDAAVAQGNGSEAQRDHVREMIRTADEKGELLMKEFLKMSTVATVVFARESGHFVQLTQPDVVVDGVMWVLDRVGASPSSS